METETQDGAALPASRGGYAAAVASEKYPGDRRRIVVIDEETRVRETTIYDWDSAREWRRKEKAALR